MLQVVVRSKGSCGLRSSANYQAPPPLVGEDFFLSGSQEPGPGCVTLSRGLCFSGLSLPVYTVGMGGGWTLFPKQPFPLSPSLHSPWTLSLSLLVALDVRPLWLPHLVPCPQHRLAVPLSSSLFLPLSLTTPVSASSFLLGSRFLLSPLCLWTPAPATPGSHSDGCTGTSPPPHSHPGPGDPTVQGAPRFPFPPLLPPPCGAISVEVPLGIGALPPQSPLT